MHILVKLGGKVSIVAQRPVIIFGTSEVKKHPQAKRCSQPAESVETPEVKCLCYLQD